MQKKRRIKLLDEIRGFCILLMVIYHALYDAVYILEIESVKDIFFKLTFFQPFVAAIFVILSGISSRLSSNNIKRGIKLLIISILLTLATRIIIPEQTIYFGIIHMLSISILVFALARPLIDKIPPAAGAAVSILLFFLTYGLQYGYIGIENILKISISKKLFDYLYLYPFGLPHQGFSSADYFPLIPWLFIFLAGAYLGVYVKKGKGVPKWAYKERVSFFSFLGRHSLIVYLLHQPALYGLFWAWQKLSSLF